MKVTVIMPSYNQEAFIRASLDSVLVQDPQPLEVLVFDGGSTDDTVSILESYGEQIEFVSKPDEGQADAINQGLQRAKGDILAYLNSDDIYYPHTLARVTRHFEIHDDCAALYGDAWHLHEDGSIMRSYHTERWDYTRLFDTCFLCQPAVFWRREVMERFGLFDPSLRFAIDYEYWLRVGQRIAFHYLEERYLAGSRLHDATKTLKHAVEAHRESLEVVMRYCPEPPYAWLMHLASVTADTKAMKQNGHIDERVRRGMIKDSLLADAKHYGLDLDSAFVSDPERFLRARELAR